MALYRLPAFALNDGLVRLFCDSVVEQARYGLYEITRCLSDQKVVHPRMDYGLALLIRHRQKPFESFEDLLVFARCSQHRHERSDLTDSLVRVQVHRAFSCLLTSAATGARGPETCTTHSACARVRVGCAVKPHGYGLIPEMTPTISPVPKRMAPENPMNPSIEVRGTVANLGQNHCRVRMAIRNQVPTTANPPTNTSRIPTTGETAAATPATRATATRLATTRLLNRKGRLMRFNAIWIRKVAG